MANIQSIITNGNGNVLIGTTTDNGSKLNVNGSYYGTGNITLITAGYPLIDLGVTTSNYFRINFDNPNDRLVIGKNGASSFILNASGSAVFSSTISATKGQFSDASGAGSVLEVYNTVATNATTAVIRQTTAGGNGNQDIGLLVDIQGAGDTDRIANFRYYDGSTYTSRMAILRGGNVGIGTASPSHKLTVSRATEAAAYQININNDGGISNGNFTGIRFSQGAGGTTELGNIKLHYYSTGATDLSFGTRYDTQAIYIKNGGNVGIGTTNPQGLLQIGANSLFDNSDASNAFNLKQTSTTAATGIYLERSGERKGYYIYVGGSVDSLTFQRNNSGTKADVMSLTRDGDVGIGTTSPAHKLDIGSNTSETVRISATATSGSTANLLFGSNIITSQAARIQGIYGGSWDGALAFFTQDAGAADGNRMTEKVRILSNGNVGINTTAPQQLLHVLGATNGYAMIQGASDSGQAGIYFKKEDTTGTMDRTKGLIVFHTNVGSGWGRGHLGFCLNSADSNTVVSVSDEKFRMVDNGDFLADGDVVAYSTTISDARYKTNIQPIESALDKVNQMRGVSFDWTAVRSGREFGVIAQEIEQIAPEVVSEKELLNGDTMKTVSYTSLVPFLIESIKELTQQVNELKAQLDGLTK
jgi:hypothetical protein